MTDASAGWPPDLLVVLLDPSGAVISCGESSRVDGALPTPEDAKVFEGRDFGDLSHSAGITLSEATERTVRDACRGLVPMPVRVVLQRSGPTGPAVCIVTVASRFADDRSCLGATVTIQGVEDVVPVVDENWTQLKDGSRPISQALDAIDDSVVILRTPSLWPVYANQAALQWHGQNDIGGLESAGWNALQPKALSRLVDVIQGVAAGEVSSERLLLEATKSSGETAWLDITARGLTGTGHPSVSPPHILLVAHDVTERVGIEERLRISEESFRATFEHSTIPTLVATLTPGEKRRIVMANQALADATGRRLEDLVGTRAELFREPVPEEDSRRFTDAFIAGEQDVGTWLKADRRPDGSPAWFEVMVSRIDLAGEDTPAALVHLLDVTDKVLTSRRRERQTQVISAHARLVTRVLKGESFDDVEQSMLDDLRAALDADDVALVVQDAEGHPGGARVLRGSGPAAELLAANRTTLASGVVERLTDARQTLHDRHAAVGDTPRPGLRADAIARFDVDDRRGWVCVDRTAPPLDSADLEVIGGFSRQTAMALELGRARVDQERLRRLQERHRLARDLHDTVLQDLIAMGIQLGLARRHLEGEAERRVQGAMTDLVATVRTLRTAVFELQRPLDEESFAEALDAVTGAAARALGHTPTLTVAGDLDVVPAALRADVVAVLQEGLSNVIRHARSSAVEVVLDVAADRLGLWIADDGVGVTGGRPPGQGLVNLAARAEAAGGTSELVSRDPRGAVLTWSVPLPDRVTVGRAAPNG